MAFPSKYTPQATSIARQYAEQRWPFPSFARLAGLLGVDRRTLHRWRGKHPDFDLACQAIEARQLLWQHLSTAEEYRQRLEQIDRELKRL